MVEVLVVASNSIVRHPRIYKIVESLKKKYLTTVLGWNREGISLQESQGYLVDLSLFQFRAPFGRPSLIFYYPIFWTWIFIKLLKFRPKVVHAIDLDTLFPCCVYKFLFRKKLLFDVHDRFGGYVPQNYTTLHSTINLLEELLCKQANVLVTVSEKVQDTFRSRPKYCAVITNFSEDYEFEKVRSEDGYLTLVYTGLITKDQGLEKIASAIADLNGVQLVIAGRVVDKELLNQMLKLNNIQYRGLLKRPDSLRLEASSDVMMVLYDLKYRKNKLSSPNKVFEAMMCGIPLITNMESELVHNEVGCGIIVDFNDTNQIKQAVIFLRDNPEIRRKMGENGRKAFEEKYNWNLMEEKLYEIYNNLLHEEHSSDNP